MVDENSFVLINFVGRVVSTNRIFDLTDRSVAEKEGLSLDYNFSPIPTEKSLFTYLLMSDFMLSIT